MTEDELKKENEHGLIKIEKIKERKKDERIWKKSFKHC